MAMDYVFTAKEVAARAGLTPRSVRDLSYRSDLIRGEDFFVRRRWIKFPGIHYRRRQLLFTQRGMARIVARNYRWFKRRALPADVDLAAVQVDWKSLAGMGNAEERRLRLQNYLARFILAYPRSGGCALPGCRCICHELGLPRADLVAELLRPPGR